ncbi:MAG: hypothetical protein JWM34_1992 [Ilumatobacteraceae bacterium]|nr:hypothetical protein [Ilumatobacteraceae bacterium]
MSAVKGPGVVGEPGAVAVEPARRRVRVMVDGTWVGDSEHAVLLFEHGFTPRWYLPAADVRTDLLAPNGRTTDTLGRGVARWYDLRVGDHVVEDAAWDHPSPPSSCPSLDGLISFEWNLMDAWFEEDDQAFVHPRDPYTRVEVLASSRHVTVSLDGIVLAETIRPLVLVETTAPTRYYIHPLDVRRELLVPSESFTWCPYKGRASYWNVRIGDTLHRDVLWSYPQPFEAAHRVANHLCAFNEFTDIHVDGHAVGRPQTKWTYGGPNAYTFRAGDEPWDPTIERDWNGDDPGVHR